MKYHLSYDVQDSNETRNDEILKKITAKLIALDDNIKISRPVASTLLIESNKSWNEIVRTINSFRDDIHYTLTQVALIDGKYRKKTHPNDDYVSRYEKIFNEIKNNPNDTFDFSWQ